MSDAAAAAYVSELLRDDVRRLHSLVAANPLAATRCFHWTVRLVIRTLFNCADKPGSAEDGIPAHCESGVFGHVRAFFGVVEPQMRKAANSRDGVHTSPEQSPNTKTFLTYFCGLKRGASQARGAHVSIAGTIC